MAVCCPLQTWNTKAYEHIKKQMDWWEWTLAHLTMCSVDFHRYIDTNLAGLKFHTISKTCEPFLGELYNLWCYFSQLVRRQTYANCFMITQQSLGHREIAWNCYQIQVQMNLISGQGDWRCFALVPTPQGQVLVVHGRSWVRRPIY